MSLCTGLSAQCLEPSPPRPPPSPPFLCSSDRGAPTVAAEPARRQRYWVDKASTEPPPLDIPPTSTHSLLHLGRSLSAHPLPERRSLAIGVAPTTVCRVTESPSTIYVVLVDPALQDELECPAAAGSSFSPTSVAVVRRDRFRLPSALPFTQGPPCAAP